MDTPNMMRGEFYNTHMVAKCRSFKKCHVCGMCENFSRYQKQCMVCETRKKPIQICTCPPETKYYAWKAIVHQDGPLFDPSRSGSITKVDESKADYWNEVSAAMSLPRVDRI